MSAIQSNLSAANYGYDYVVAVTQAAINSSYKEFLNSMVNRQVTVCFVANQQGIPTPIDYKTLVADAKGADPFSIPNGADISSNPELANLHACRFVTAFQFQIGTPNIPGCLVPEFIELTNTASFVQMNLLCQEFTIIEVVNNSTLNRVSQSIGQAWTFSCRAQIYSNQVQPAQYGSLPVSVQQSARMSAGGPLNIQALNLDLTSTTLLQWPAIPGIVPGSPAFDPLINFFMPAYLSRLKAEGIPALFYTVADQVRAGSFGLTLANANYMGRPYTAGSGQPAAYSPADERELATLNCMCTVQGKPFLPPMPLAWNWIDPSQQAQFQGVAAINRDLLANYIFQQIISQVQQNCYQANVRVTLNFLVPEYNGQLFPGQTPAISRPPGQNVLNFTFNSTAFDQAGLGGDLGRLRLSSNYNCSVSFIGNTITIQQHLVVYLMITELQARWSGNVVDITITDTWQLGTNGQGEFITSNNSQRVDNSTDVINTFLPRLMSLQSNIQIWRQNLNAITKLHIPVDVLQNSVFPDGSYMNIQDAAFSEYQDLIMHFIYKR
ncbi:MAG: hypothetical protein LWX56_09200 [Ignavibacteria bacterium]|nr:hypothetical protein [Ignavibacteria bacterium]